jgi:hypothetical protein
MRNLPFILEAACSLYGNPLKSSDGRAVNSYLSDQSTKRAVPRRRRVNAGTAENKVFLLLFFQKKKNLLFLKKKKQKDFYNLLYGFQPAA